MAATLAPAFRRILRYSDATRPSVSQMPKIAADNNFNVAESGVENLDNGDFEEENEGAKAEKISVLEHPLRKMNDTFV
jgi:hypothetical protein